MEPPRLDDQLCFQLYTATRMITRAYQPILGEYGLTYPQYLVLMVLWEWSANGEEATVASLGRRLHLDSGTLTPLLKRMESHGWVKRERSDRDGRVVDVVLTDKGLQLSKDAYRIPRTLMCSYDGPVEDIATLREQLRGLLAHLQG